MLRLLRDSDVEPGPRRCRLRPRADAEIRRARRADLGALPLRTLGIIEIGDAILGRSGEIVESLSDIYRA